ncbi:MAG: hypothetical protein M5U17_09350 [Ignavibacterium sp.]|nr:hypothetical protein [Ignavibacterium sp.]
MMRLLNKIVFFGVLLCPIIVQPQFDSTKYNDNNLRFNPRFIGMQIEAVSLIFVNEIGGLVDFDLYSSANKYYNLGIRLSLEYSKVLTLDVGGAGSDEAVLNYNMYAKHTIKGSVFWFSFLAGASVQKQQDYSETKTHFISRAGFELRYNLTDYEIAVLFKGAKSFVESSGYLGIGFSLGFHLL